MMVGFDASVAARTSGESAAGPFAPRQTIVSSVLCWPAGWRSRGERDREDIGLEQTMQSPRRWYDCKTASGQQSGD